ncbi:MAG: integrin alpha, partial [Vicinamibacteria bacterium]
MENAIARREYEASRNELGLQAPNRAHGLRTYFEPSGVRVHDRTAEGSPELVEFELAAVGRGVERGVVEPGEVFAAGARVEIRRGELTEWYENSPQGLEQGFDLATRPRGDGELFLELTLSGVTARAREDGLELRAATGRRLRYEKLVAFDAKHASLPARMQLVDGSRLQLVVDDSGATYPLTIDPLLSATEDTIIEGNQTNAQLGVHLSAAGDVNGDGFGDVIIGASLYDNGQTDEGAAFLFLGSATGIADLDAASADTVFEPNQASALFGRSVAGAGDVNGDGYDDVIVGARTYDSGQTNEGVAFIWLGGPTGIADGTPLNAAATLQGNQGGAEFGMCVAGAGDVNGDGYADVIVGAWAYDAGQTNEGAAFVFHGGPTGVVSAGAAAAPTQLESDQGGSSFGAACSTAGDVNADGYADVLVGARDYDNGQTNEGGVFVFLGSATGVADASVTTAHARLESDQGGGELGWDVDTAGDVNGDGYSDVIAGAIIAGAGQADEGLVFIWHGSSTGIVANGNPTNAATQLETNQASAQLFSVGGGGDINGDGYGDVIVGARFWDGGQTDEGGAWVFFGGAGGIADGNPATADVALEADQAGSNFGFDTAMAGDVNGDGFADFAAAAYGWIDSSLTAAGRVYVHLG